MRLSVFPPFAISFICSSAIIFYKSSTKILLFHEL